MNFPLAPRSWLGKIVDFWKTSLPREIKFDEMAKEFRARLHPLYSYSGRDFHVQSYDNVRFHHPGQHGEQAAVGAAVALLATRRSAARQDCDVGVSKVGAARLPPRNRQARLARSGSRTEKGPTP